uniref:Uncharacterized protein n=1 Tax=Rhizophora mucronata TaxID=61149 RepID=A0A2P2JIT6_RHIMU
MLDAPGRHLKPPARLIFWFGRPFHMQIIPILMKTYHLAIVRESPPVLGCYYSSTRFFTLVRIIHVSPIFCLGLTSSISLIINCPVLSTNAYQRKARA